MSSRSVTNKLHEMNERIHELEAENTKLQNENHTLAESYNVDSEQWAQLKHELEAENARLRKALKKILEEAKYPNAESVETLGEIMEISSKALGKVDGNRL